MNYQQGLAMSQFEIFSPLRIIELMTHKGSMWSVLRAYVSSCLAAGKR